MSIKNNIAAVGLTFTVMFAVGAANASAPAIIKCDSKKKVCEVYADYKLLPAHVSSLTRKVYPGVNPDVVKIGKEWQVRFTYLGVLTALTFIECGSAK